MKKALAGVILFSGIALTGCANNKTVASSTAGKISQEAFYDKMKEAVGSQVLQQMLLEDVLEKRAGETVTKKDIDKAFNDEVERFGGEEALNYALMSQGMTMEQYKDNIRLNLLVKEVVREKANISDEEIKAAYEEYQPEMTAAHILVSDKEEAEKLIKELEDGADFAELAKENSEDTGTAEQGGVVTFTTGEMVPEFEEAALKMNEGDLSKEPVKTSYGYHIIKMMEKPKKGSFEEEKDQIVDRILEEKMSDSEYVHTVLSDVVKDANIIINDKDLSDAMDAYKPLPDPEDGSDGDSTEEEIDSEEEADSETDSTEDSTSETESETDSSNE